MPERVVNIFEEFISPVGNAIYKVALSPDAMMPIPSFLIAMAVTMVITWRMIPALKRMNTVQNIYEDAPDSHQTKQGTPTMGGIAIIAGIVVASIYAHIIGGFDMKLLVVTLVAVGFGLIGFIDDYTKIAAGRNKGLTPKQKLALQIALSLAFAFYLMVFDANGHTVIIPFVWKSIDIGWFILPYIVFILVAMTNAVNLTDGLDGLCAVNSGAVSLFFPSLLYMAGISWATVVTNEMFVLDPLDPIANEMASHIGFGADGVIGLGGAAIAPMARFFTAIAGSCFGFLIFNRHPAKIFMGDTGSLALGGAIAAAAIWAKAELLLPIVGVIFVAEALSVIIQVLSYRFRGGKRVFRMAPLHHHFELSGLHETKVVGNFLVVTILMFAALLILLGISS